MPSQQKKIPITPSSQAIILKGFKYTDGTLYSGPGIYNHAIGDDVPHGFGAFQLRCDPFDPYQPICFWSGVKTSVERCRSETKVTYCFTGLQYFISHYPRMNQYKLSMSEYDDDGHLVSQRTLMYKLPNSFPTIQENLLHGELMHLTIYMRAESNGAAALVTAAAAPQGTGMLYTITPDGIEYFYCGDMGLSKGTSTPFNYGEGVQRFYKPKNSVIEFVEGRIEYAVPIGRMLVSRQCLQNKIITMIDGPSASKVKGEFASLRSHGKCTESIFNYGSQPMTYVSNVGLYEHGVKHGEFQSSNTVGTTTRLYYNNDIPVYERPVVELNQKGEITIMQLQSSITYGITLTLDNRYQYFKSMRHMYPNQNQFRHFKSGCSDFVALNLKQFVDEVGEIIFRRVASADVRKQREYDLGFLDYLISVASFSNLLFLQTHLRAIGKMYYADKCLSLYIESPPTGLTENAYDLTNIPLADLNFYLRHIEIFLSRYRVNSRLQQFVNLFQLCVTAPHRFSKYEELTQLAFQEKDNLNVLLNEYGKKLEERREAYRSWVIAAVLPGVFQRVEYILESRKAHPDAAYLASDTLIDRMLRDLRQFKRFKPELECELALQKNQKSEVSELLLNRHREAVQFLAPGTALLLTQAKEVSEATLSSMLGFFHHIHSECERLRFEEREQELRLRLQKSWQVEVIFSRSRLYLLEFSVTSKQCITQLDLEHTRMQESMEQLARVDDIQNELKQCEIDTIIIQHQAEQCFLFHAYISIMLQEYSQLQLLFKAEWLQLLAGIESTRREVLEQMQASELTRVIVKLQLTFVLNLLRQYATLYVVGGAVRSLLQNQPLKAKQDIDLVLATHENVDTFNLLDFYKSKYVPGLFIKEIEIPGLGMYLVEVFVIQSPFEGLDFVRANYSTRDFTMGCLYLGRDFVVVDPTRRGKPHVQANMLDLVLDLSIRDSVNQFLQNPVQVFRAMKFIANGYQPIPALHQILLRFDANVMSVESSQHITAMLRKNLSGDNRINYTNILIRYHLLEKCFGIQERDPDIASIQLMQQNYRRAVVELSSSLRGHSIYQATPTHDVTAQCRGDASLGCFNG